MSGGSEIMGPTTAHPTSQSLPGHYGPRRMSEKSLSSRGGGGGGGGGVGGGPQQHVGPLHPHLAVEDKSPDSEEAETETPLVAKRGKEMEEDAIHEVLGKALGGVGGGGGELMEVAVN